MTLFSRTFHCLIAFLFVSALALPSFSLYAATVTPEYRINTFQSLGQSLLEFARHYTFSKIEIVREDIPFSTNYIPSENDKTTIVEKGENGIKEVTYRVSFSQGKEVKRELLGEKIIKEPKKQVVSSNWDLVYTCKNMSYYTSYWTVNRFVSYRKKFFYQHDNDPRFFIANKELPLGTRVKIVAKESGKSVYANVTDYGPVGGCVDASYWTFGAVCDHDRGRCAVDLYKMRDTSAN